MAVAISKVEAAVGAAAVCLIAVASSMAFDATRAVLCCGLGWTMLAIATSDAKRFIIPDVLSLPAIPLGLIATYLINEPEGASGAVFVHTVAAAAAFAFLWLVRRGYHVLRQTHGLGLGDVKLGAVAGAWTGLQGAPNVLLLACLLAIAYVLCLTFVIGRPLTRTSVLPLGVFLAPAIWIIWSTSNVNMPTPFYLTPT